MATTKPFRFKFPEYDQKLDFYGLALKDEDFSEILRSNGGHFDWKIPEHLVQLTKSILKRDFGLKLKLPANRLCPPIPIRWSYIRWIQELIDSTTKDYHQGYDPSRSVTGIDIGVGSSCIYPLLGCVARSNWKFVGTDIDETNYNHAIYNVTNNELDKRIRLVKTLPVDPLFSLDRLNINKADFTMCNPPFFESRNEMMSTFDKSTSPSAICTGADVEMVTDGGETAFVSKMADESKALGERVQWYTSMLGKASSLPIVINKLKTLGCSNWAVGILNPLEQTRRWVIGWSWGDLRPKSNIARQKDISAPQVWPTEYPIAIPGHSKQQLTASVNAIFADLALEWSFDPLTLTGVGITVGNTWSRHARRKRKLEATHASSPSSVSNQSRIDNAVVTPAPSTSNSNQVMVFRMYISQDLVNIRWLKGTDDVLWDSLCGMVRRKLTGNVAMAKISDEGKVKKADGKAKEDQVQAKKDDMDTSR